MGHDFVATCGVAGVVCSGCPNSPALGKVQTADKMKEQVDEQPASKRCVILCKRVSKPIVGLVAYSHLNHQAFCSLGTSI